VNKSQFRLIANSEVEAQRALREQLAEQSAYLKVQVQELKDSVKRRYEADAGEELPDLRDVLGEQKGWLDQLQTLDQDLVAISTGLEGVLKALQSKRAEIQTLQEGIEKNHAKVEAGIKEREIRSSASAQEKISLDKTINALVSGIEKLDVELSDHLTWMPSK
jgi:chromosome segregation ATPase